MNASCHFVGRHAPWLFVLLWSTGFIGSKYGLAYAEPFTLLALRFVLTLALLAPVVAWLKPVGPQNWRERGHLAVSGLLLHGVYLGGIFYAIGSGMSAGLTALIVGVQPLLTSALAPRLLGERVGFRHWLGLALGFAGLVLVLGAGGESGQGGAVALVAAIVALVGITAGTLYQKRFCAQHDVLAVAWHQYWPTLLAFAVAAWLIESRTVVWGLPLMLALAWLALALSVGAILLLAYLIKHGEASRVASLFYLVPPATALEAYWLFGEPLGVSKIAGMALVAVGVYLVLRPRGGAHVSTGGQGHA